MRNDGVSNRIKTYLAARDAMPMPQLGDAIHTVNIGSEFEGELRLSDLRALAASHAGLLAALSSAAVFVRDHYAPAFDSEHDLMQLIDRALASAESQS